MLKYINISFQEHLKLNILFLHKNESFCFRRPLLTPWSCLKFVYDGWLHIFELQSVGCDPLPL